MEKLGGDQLLLIFNKFDNPDDGISLSQVSKNFLAVSFIHKPRLRRALGHRLFDMLYNWLPDILTSFPNLESFYCSKPLSNNHIKLLANSCPNLSTLDLSLKSEGDFAFDFNDDGLCAVANACKRLSRVDLSGRLHVGDVGVCSLMTSCRNLWHLNLNGCVGITDESLKAIGGSCCWKHLGLRGCNLITDLGLKHLTNGCLKGSLRFLDLSLCDRISDDGIMYLRQMINLHHLYLSKCGVNVTDAGIVELVFKVWNLTDLDLSWLINVTDISLRVIARWCYFLKSIDLSGCEAITGEGLFAFKCYPNLQSIKLYSCHNISWEDVKSLAKRCRWLRYVKLDVRMKMPMPDDYVYKIDRCQIDWK